MRKLFYISILFPIMLQAQEKEQRYLLNDFTLSVATSKQGPPIRESFNYDCVKQEMQFEEDGEILKLQSINNIDTLFLGDHKMVPYAGRFLDAVHITAEYKLLIDYKRKQSNKGKKGAMGSTTQGTVENIDISSYRLAHSDKIIQDNALYDYKDETSYVLELNGKIKKFSDTKSFIKLFPEKKEQIDAYIKEQKVTFKNTEAIISLIDFSIK